MGVESLGQSFMTIQTIPSVVILSVTKNVSNESRQTLASKFSFKISVHCFDTLLRVLYITVGSPKQLFSFCGSGI